MPIQAQSADGVTHEFPDDTDQAVIGKVMKTYALQHTKTAAPGYKFSDDAINGAIKNSANVVYMKPQSYLDMTPDLPSNPHSDKKGASLAKSLAKGDDVDEVPSLDVTVGKDGTAKVVDQDGRHRAQFAKDAGVDLIPVAVKRSGEKGLITHLAGMKDGSEPVPFDFKPVLPPQKAKPAATAPTVAPDKPAGLPRWDVPGDIGRVAEGAVKATGDDLKAAFPNPLTMDKGPVATAKRLGNALKAPLDAMGVVASPVTGAAHALLGSPVAAALEYAPIPGHDPKADADQMIDQAMVGVGPEGMEGGAAGIVAKADAALSAKTTANNLAKVENLRPGVVEAHAAGYVLPPAMAKVKPNVVESVASGSGGKIKLQQGASVRNQEVTNRLAAEDLGLPPDTPLNEKAFREVRKTAAGAYKAVANAVPEIVVDQKYKDNIAALGGRNSAAGEQFPGVMKNDELDTFIKNVGAPSKFTPDAGLEVVRKLRKDAVGNMKALGDPNKTALGLAQRKAADEIDELIERNLTAQGKGDLVKEYRAARQMLAKSHDVEGATNTATGDVSAIGLGRLAAKGRPFTGNLKTIADTANAFPKAVQNTAAFGGDEAYSALDAFGAIGALAAHQPGAAAAIIARPGVRNALLSKMYQSRMIPEGLPNIPPPQGGLALLHNTPLPGVQNQLAKGIFRAAHVNGLRSINTNALRSMLSGQNPQPPQGQ